MSLRGLLDGIEGVIFDLDGTLVDSMGMWKQIDIEFLGGLGLDMPEDLQRSIEGRSFYETALYFKERFGLSASVSEIMDTWNEMAADMYTNRIPLKKGASDFLDFLKSRDIRIGISTSNSGYLTDIILNAHGIRDYFDCIRAGCNEISGKPAPDVYLLSAQDLKLDPKNCLVFEDLVAGILAGKAAGMKVCAVKDDFSEYQLEEKQRLSDYYISNYFEITDSFKDE